MSTDFKTNLQCSFPMFALNFYQFLSLSLVGVFPFHVRPSEDGFGGVRCYDPPLHAAVNLPVAFLLR